MRYLSTLLVVLVLMNTNFGQNMNTLIADGTVEVPKKYDLQPTVEGLKKEEVEAVKKAALAMETEFPAEADQSFELLDVAEGFFISREIECRAYLYSAHNSKTKRRYQGILVLDISNNGTKYTPKAHYAYDYRGDRYIRRLSDINGNFLSEIAVFSASANAKSVRKTVRIIEFSQRGVEKIRSAEIYSSIPQKQRSPNSLDKDAPAKKVYSLAIVRAVKVYVAKGLVKPPEFYEERWKQNGDNWSITDKLQLRPSVLEIDNVNYIEILKPDFPKGPK